MTSNEKIIILIIVMEVGPLGFMCLDSDEAGGNMGLLDMVVALEVSLRHLTPLLITIIVLIITLNRFSN